MQKNQGVDERMINVQYYYKLPNIVKPLAPTEATHSGTKGRANPADS